eukprot:4891186-Pleurochrysis_carterae.AAC.1
MMGLRPKLGCGRGRDGGLKVMVDSASDEVVDAQVVSANGVEASGEEASDVEASDEEGGWHLEWRRCVERRLPSSRVKNVRVER